MSGSSSRDPGSLASDLAPFAALDAVIISSPVPTVVLDRGGSVRLWNPAAERVLGWSAQEVLGHPHPAKPDEELDAYTEQCARALRGEILVGLEGTKCTKDSVMLAVRVAVAPLRTEAGHVVGVVRTFEDISTEREAEALLREQAALIDLTLDAILVRDFETDTIRLWNRGAEELYGYTASEVLGRVAQEVLGTVHPVSRDEQERVLLTTGHWEGQLRQRSKDGRAVVVASRWAVAWSGDQPTAILETNTDITERTRREQEQADLAAQNAIFLSAAAHDLKNPLTALQGHAQLLQRRVQGGTVDQARVLLGLAEIEHQARSMTALIDGVLDATRLRMAGRLDLTLQPVDLVALVHQTIAEQQEAAPTHRIVLKSAADHLVGKWDGPRLRRVLSNLVGNAVKYSPAGSDVTVRLSQDVSGAVLSVQDHGIGIPADDLPQVFDWLYRARNVSRAVSGTGIGLAGARQIVEQHAGTITVESVVDVGSTFIVRLPLRPHGEGSDSRCDTSG